MSCLSSSSPSDVQTAEVYSSHIFFYLQVLLNRLLMFPLSSTSARVPSHILDKNTKNFMWVGFRTFLFLSICSCSSGLVSIFDRSDVKNWRHISSWSTCSLLSFPHPLSSPQRTAVFLFQLLCFWLLQANFTNENFAVCFNGYYDPQAAGDCLLGPQTDIAGFDIIPRPETVEQRFLQIFPTINTSMECYIRLALSNNVSFFLLFLAFYFQKII